ncbi:carbohydrate phosphatase [Aaosphaeria arxii CBS 175.79]|uniref:Carbohydrate phosphatase n=1 Tax=Aaosphaeria arxii CBS 175.79 TaxID=1450172 RepID=A0A6A5XT39_9PLEO|nr:carbohydrate phosphatase [Aaosphaeria arxii CBS 175.79]KAF2016372.1 carbohydrate phosphatase [Aaosphaeria arxii CBS 175.79]
MSAQQPTPNLSSHLTALFANTPDQQKPTSLLTSVLPTLISSIGSVANALRTTQGVSQVGTANAFGDDQLNVDVIAEDILRDAIASCPSIRTASSEEDPVEKAVQHKHRDGATPHANAGDEVVGAIIGIWRGESALNSDPSTQQIGAILGVFGPRTTAVVALRVPGTGVDVCFEVAVSDGASEFPVVRPSIKLDDAPFKTRYFAPANLRAAGEEPRYMALLNHFIENRYTLRYCGGLVPDIVHALVKGHGVYVSPVTATSKAKLRRLYELAPIALIMECAGGMAVDASDGKNVLERQIGDTDERAGLICGTKEEVEFVRKSLLE